MSDASVLRFVKILIGGAVGREDGGYYNVSSKSGRAVLDVSQVEHLAINGLVDVKKGTCRARPEARNWLKRQISDQHQHAAQHRNLHVLAGDLEINLNESPLAKLACSTNGKPAFLAPHHLLAGERVRNLVEKAHLRQSVTMSYDPTRLPTGPNQSAGTNISDMAIDARRALDDVKAALSADCAGAVIDICGFLKGLQQVETERQWPRRSAKLVLRIGLEQVANHFGYSEMALGTENHRDHNWLDQGGRPTRYS